MDILKGGTRSGTTTVVATVASIDRDRVVFNLPTHTAKAPRNVIFTRSLPGGGDSDVLRLGIKLVSGDRNTDGSLKSGNSIVEVNARLPQDQDVALATEELALIAGILADTSWVSSWASSGKLPYA